VEKGKGINHPTTTMEISTINREIHMRFFKLGVTIVCLVSCLFISKAFAADETKIGLIDFQKILTTSEAGKVAQGKIEEKGKALEAELKTKGAAIEEEKARYEREAAVMSKEARSEKERELKIKILDIQDLEAKYKADFNAFSQELINQFKADVLTVVDQIGKKEGFLLILEKRESGVVYATSTIDITDKVIQQYNGTYSKK
jgi:outer membrane protein